MDEYKLVAPDIDALLNTFSRDYMNPSKPSDALWNAMTPLFDSLLALAPIKKNNEVKAIWLVIPRGTIEDYDSYEDMVSWGEVKTREEYEERWKEDYPDPDVWYELVVGEGIDKDGTVRSRYINFGDKIIVNAVMDNCAFDDKYPEYLEDAAVKLCSLLTEAAEESMKKIRAGVYNDLVRDHLPYKFRTGVIKRSVVWQRFPEFKKNDLEGIEPETISEFRKILESGGNDKDRLKVLRSMTANDFFQACAIGYKACGYMKTDLSPVEQYRIHADGRDEGLTGKDYGLDKGSGIDPADPKAWDEWYFNRDQHGGHPWEVCRGGNSTHVDLYVVHDRNYINFMHEIGKITDDEYRILSEKAGYYFNVAGKKRPAEAVNFFVSLSKAGFPVLLSDADEILDLLEGNGLIGIVPHSVPTRYCEGRFPEKNGKIIDFIHIYDDEIQDLEKDIEWIPEEEARLEIGGL